MHLTKLKKSLALMRVSGLETDYAYSSAPWPAQGCTYICRYLHTYISQ